MGKDNRAVYGENMAVVPRASAPDGLDRKQPVQKEMKLLVRNHQTDECLLQSIDTDNLYILSDKGKYIVAAELRTKTIPVSEPFDNQGEAEKVLRELHETGSSVETCYD